jgi:hypothetical protein
MIYSQKVYRGVELLKEIKEFEDRLEGSEDKSERTVLAEEIERCRKELRGTRRREKFAFDRPIYLNAGSVAWMESRLRDTAPARRI